MKSLKKVMNTEQLPEKKKKKKWLQYMKMHDWNKLEEMTND